MTQGGLYVMTLTEYTNQTCNSLIFILQAFHETLFMKKPFYAKQLTQPTYNKINIIANNFIQNKKSIY